MIEIIFLFCIYKIKLYLCSVIKDPLCPFGHLTSIAQRTALPSLRHRLTFSQSSKGLVRPLWEELAIGRRQEGERTTKRAKREKESDISIELGRPKMDVEITDFPSEKKYL